MKSKKVLPLISLLFVALMIWGQKDSRMVVSKNKNQTAKLLNRLSYSYSIKENVQYNRLNHHHIRRSD